MYVESVKRGIDDCVCGSEDSCNNRAMLVLESSGHAGVLEYEAVVAILTYLNTNYSSRASDVGFVRPPTWLTQLKVPST